MCANATLLALIELYKASCFSDWPDYTSSDSDTESEVETIIGGKDDRPHHHDDRLHSDQGQGQHSDTDMQEPHHKRTRKHSHTSNRSRNHSSSQSDLPLHQGQGHTTVQGHIPGQGHIPITSATEEQTAHKILNLLNELGHSNLVDRSASIEEQFHPCKYCKGRLQIL